MTAICGKVGNMFYLRHKCLKSFSCPHALAVPIRWMVLNCCYVKLFETIGSDFKCVEIVCVH